MYSCVFFGKTKITLHDFIVGEQFTNYTTFLVPKQVRISTIDGKYTSICEKYFANDRADKLSTAKVFFFSVSVLCLGNIDEYPRQVRHLKGEVRPSGFRVQGCGCAQNLFFGLNCFTISCNISWKNFSSRLGRYYFGTSFFHVSSFFFIFLHLFPSFFHFSRFFIFSYLFFHLFFLFFFHISIFSKKKMVLIFFFPHFFLSFLFIFFFLVFFFRFFSFFWFLYIRAGQR